jgi:RNA polymerase sigma-70 factor (ECF subfamily)
MRIEDKLLFNEIKNRNQEVFEALFREYYPILTRYAESFIFDRALSETWFRLFFVSLWDNAVRLNFRTP